MSKAKNYTLGIAMNKESRKAVESIALYVCITAVVCVCITAVVLVSATGGDGTFAAKVVGRMVAK